MESVLELQHVDAGYGRVQILNDLSFQVARGEVLGVIGPNGCGKTTMFNTVIGHILPFRGSIRFLGEDITKTTPSRRCRAGIGRTYQIPRPFEKMTVFENVLVAAVHGAGLREREGGALCRQALALTGLQGKEELPAGSLPLLDRKRLEIARALGTRPQILLLDEVAAGLTDAEVKDVMALVADLKAAGNTIIWIEHIIETMVHATDRLLCMCDGRELLCGEPLAVMRSREVEEVYLGAEEEEQ